MIINKNFDVSEFLQQQLVGKTIECFTNEDPIYINSRYANTFANPKEHFGFNEETQQFYKRPDEEFTMQPSNYCKKPFTATITDIMWDSEGEYESETYFYSACFKNAMGRVCSVNIGW